ncbi:hypothetical protein [Brevibacillus choshinensis]|uniref:hypothetical protein n=1 Tax=Brevibacillus choshinensis TaxID=54911 RepID=UPI002E1D2832|nr:hypothetical protein [Brevibacillus choshinensis]
MIVVLEKGSIIETGTHEELIRHQGRYQQLYELQFPKRHAQATQKEPLPSPR